MKTLITGFVKSWPFVLLLNVCAIFAFTYSHTVAEIFFSIGLPATTIYVSILLFLKGISFEGYQEGRILDSKAKYRRFFSVIIALSLAYCFLIGGVGRGAILFVMNLSLPMLALWLIGNLHIAKKKKHQAFHMAIAVIYPITYVTLRLLCRLSVDSFGQQQCQNFHKILLLTAVVSIALSVTVLFLSKRPSVS